MKEKLKERRQQQQQQQKTKTNKDRKEQGGDRSYSERVRNK